MQPNLTRALHLEPSICLRCLSRLSKGQRLPRRRFLSQASARNSATATGALFSRDYFSANRSTLGPPATERTLQSSRDSAQYEAPVGAAIRHHAKEPPAQQTPLQETDTTNSPPSELPHRRRKRLKDNQSASIAATDVIPPDASSQLSTISTTLPPASLRRLFSLYLSLSKPRLSFLIVLTTAAAYSLYPVPAVLLPQATASPSLSTLTLVFLTSGTALCSASANALNMIMEPEHDAKMSRTRNRPLVRGYIGRRGALVFATVAGIVGVGNLYYGVNPTVSFLGGLNIFLYAGIYTPMKRISVLNTWVGAVVGGIPPLMGWAAAAGQTATGSGGWQELLLSEESIGGWLLATFLYAWQFPHFNALSWTIRDEYKFAGYRMLAWVNPRMNGRVAFRYALLSFPICGALWWFGITDQGFLFTSSILNALIVREAWRFWRKDGYQGSARRLFWAGVWHLPSVDLAPPEAPTAGCTIYAIHKTHPIFPSSTPGPTIPPNGSLHRSNAQRRRSRHPPSGPQTLNGGMDGARDGEFDVAETENIQSDGVEADEQTEAPDDPNLLELVYRIAEDQAKKEGFVHRGVNCSDCDTMPIRGTRWRCSNCADFDLCEPCHSMQNHERTHIFYEIRIPAPLQSNPRKAAPVWYPGNPDMVRVSLSKELRNILSTRTGLPEQRIDAVWEQFQCFASGDFERDPYGFRIAIQRCDFNKSFVPSILKGTPPANLIYDRAFSFYDTNNDGLIGFEELLYGIACVTDKGPKLLTKIFEAYDLDGDGFVDRIDFMNMFTAYYALTKELTAQAISGTDDESDDETNPTDAIESSQPISSIFTGAIPSGDPSRRGTDMPMSGDGEIHIVDDQEFLIENETTDPGLGSAEDIGRDVIHQVTSQAMYELLDPMFKLRDDIADVARKTATQRHLYKQAIDDYVPGANAAIIDLFEFYQKRWYQAPQVFRAEDKSMARNFMSFVHKCTKGGEIVTKAIADAVFDENLVGQEEGPGEVFDFTAESQSAKPASPLTNGAEHSPPEYPEVPLDLGQGITAFDGATPMESSTREKPADDSPADAGYGVATSLVLNANIQLASLAWASLHSTHGDDEQMSHDPTMPQYRPNDAEEWESKYHPQEDHGPTIETQTLPPPSESSMWVLKILAALEEDDRRRGGYGRLSLTDFLHVMQGHKGRDLGFVGSWLEIVRAF
ncbi:MAG: hypothetical protein Q9168_007884 [Polycauliona sp. 1 TL-2023]